MNPKSLVLFAVLVCMARAEPTPQETDEEKAQRGMNLAKDALFKILFGEGEGNGYKDLFLDTNYNLIDFLNTLEQDITVDDLILIFFQSLIILVANKHTDLIPSDFNEKNKMFADFIKELPSLSEILATKGTKGLTLKRLQSFFKIIRSDEFWISIANLRDAIDSALDEMRGKSEL